MVRLTNLGLLTTIMIICLGLGCASTPGPLSGEIMSTETSAFVGNWEKLTSSQCSQLYPDQLEFRERGVYFGHKNQPGMFTLWDVGSYEIISPTQVKISLANDAIITYQYSLTNGILAFVDPSQCEFKYRWVS
jgi:hypothetical protein